MKKKVKFYNTYKPFSEFSKNIIINSIASISFAIVVLIFSLVRTSLIAKTYGGASIGFLGIAIGILPYISSTHGGVVTVSRYNLYDKVFNKQYDAANQTIANLKIQYYFFGFIYAIITITLAFAFPFFFNENGNIYINNDNIPWYESTIYILSNCIETFTNYLIVPISIIIFYIIKKSYISSFINIIVSTISNIIIISLLSLQLNHVINLNFVVMNIIITCILGLNTLFVLLILKPIRNKKIWWYKKLKISNKKISKDMVISICTQYLKQFNSDLYSIAFIIASNFLLFKQQHNGISLLHEGHSGSEVGFEVGGVYYIFLFLINTSYEVVHSIIDNAVPSMAEHVVINKKIHKTFFDRYKSLVYFTSFFSITTYLLTAGFSSIAMMNIEHLSNEEVILMFIMVIPFFIDIITVSYDHILPVYGKFKKILKYTFIKTTTNILIVGLFLGLLYLNKNQNLMQTLIFVAIIVGWTISSFIYLLINKRFVINRLDKKTKINVLFVLKQNLYLIFITLLSIIIYSLGLTVFNINDSIKNIGNWNYLIISAIAIINFFINVFVMKFTNTKEYNYYVKEFVCMINHYKTFKQDNKKDNSIIWDAIMK